MNQSQSTGLPRTSRTSCGGLTFATVSLESPSNPTIRTFCYGPTSQIKGRVQISWTNSSLVSGLRRNARSQSISGNSGTICLGLRHFQHSPQGQSVGVFSDNMTALSYIRKLGWDIFIGVVDGHFAKCPSSSWGRRMSSWIP